VHLLYTLNACPLQLAPSRGIRDPVRPTRSASFGHLEKECMLARITTHAFLSGKVCPLLDGPWRRRPATGCFVGVTLLRDFNLNGSY